LLPSGLAILEEQSWRNSGRCRKPRISCIIGNFMSKTTDKVLIVLVTTSTSKDAVVIGEAVVRAKRAACVNILPAVTSIYRWKGKTEKSREALLILKTTRLQYPALEKLIRSMHPYDVPEIIAIQAERGLRQYLGWVVQETTSN
jgi:periplasmic divalent cation tolerance protein